MIYYDGICPVCGEESTHTQMEVHRADKYFFYLCGVCNEYHDGKIQLLEEDLQDIFFARKD